MSAPRQPRPDSGTAFVSELDRAVRQAERKRRLDRWPPWTIEDVPNGMPNGSGWQRDIRLVAENGIFAVLIRPLPDGAHHAMISTLPGGSPPTWAEKQRIKDTLFGARWAVECFPPRDRLVDGADAYHLWIYPRGACPPFDLKND
jgi:hypothetical protein